MTPFRELWMQNGVQTFHPLRELRVVRASLIGQGLRHRNPAAGPGSGATAAAQSVRRAFAPWVSPTSGPHARAGRRAGARAARDRGRRRRPLSPWAATGRGATWRTRSLRQAPTCGSRLAPPAPATTSPSRVGAPADDFEATARLAVDGPGRRRRRRVVSRNKHLPQRDRVWLRHRGDRGRRDRHDGSRATGLHVLGAPPAVRLPGCRGHATSSGEWGGRLTSAPDADHGQRAELRWHVSDRT